MLRVLAGILGLGVCCFTSVATAQAAEAPSATHSVNPAPQGSEAPPLGPRRWYGWKGLTVDGAALSLAAAALVTASGDTQQGEDWATRLVIAGTVAYGAGGPAVHLVHDRPWAALGSLGMRGALPILGAVAWRGAVTCPPPGEEYGSCGTGPILFGLAAGAVAAMALDATLLAWDRPEREAAPGARLGLAPVISRDGQRELRLVGTF